MGRTSLSECRLLSASCCLATRRSALGSLQLLEALEAFLEAFFYWCKAGSYLRGLRGFIGFGEGMVWVYFWGLRSGLWLV